MTKETEDAGFKVTDRRSFAKGKTEDEGKEKEEATVSGGKEDTEKEDVKKEEQIPLPEMNISTFVFSLNSSALFHLGEIPDPATNKSEENMPMAKQTIDIISMLKEKTKGNLTKEEDLLIDHILYDLRMRYVEKVKKG